MCTSAHIRILLSIEKLWCIYFFALFGGQYEAALLFRSAFVITVVFLEIWKKRRTEALGLRLLRRDLEFGN